MKEPLKEELSHFLKAAVCFKGISNIGFMNTLSLKNQFSLYHLGLDTVNHKAILNILAVFLKSGKGNVHTGLCVVPALKFCAFRFSIYF